MLFFFSDLTECLPISWLSHFWHSFSGSYHKPTPLQPTIFITLSNTQVFLQALPTSTRISAMSFTGNFFDIYYARDWSQFQERIPGTLIRRLQERIPGTLVRRLQERIQDTLIRCLQWRKPQTKYRKDLVRHLIVETILTKELTCMALIGHWVCDQHVSLILVPWSCPIKILIEEGTPLSDMVETRPKT